MVFAARRRAPLTLGCLREWRGFVKGVSTDNGRSVPRVVQTPLSRAFGVLAELVPIASRGPAFSGVLAYLRGVDRRFGSGLWPSCRNSSSTSWTSVLSTATRRSRQRIAVRTMGCFLPSVVRQFAFECDVKSNGGGQPNDAIDPTRAQNSSGTRGTDLTIEGAQFWRRAMPPVHYHTGGFPPGDLDWPKLIPFIGPASASPARYDGRLRRFRTRACCWRR